jgi:hypothetical protein
MMWVLTSTVRPLRDKATRALYWYGRRQPEQFLDLVLNSLEINDPYVPERMLAATYVLQWHGNMILRIQAFLKSSTRIWMPTL